MMNFNHLYYFHVVALERSFASASQILGVTQPTISEQVKALERTLGETLFDRQQSGLRLTDAGLRTLERTTIMFGAAERMRRALGEELVRSPLHFRVGISGLVGRTTPAELFLPLFALPGAVPSIRSGEANDLLRDLRDHELDLVLIESEPVGAVRGELAVVLVDRPTLVAVTAPRVTAAADWANLGMIHLRASAEYQWEVQTYLEAHQLRPRLVAEADDVVFILDAVSRDGYVAFLPEPVAREAVAAGRIQVIATLEAPQAGVFAVHHDVPASSAARHAIDRLLEHVSAQTALRTTG